MPLSNPEPSCFDCLYLFSLSFWYLSFAFFFLSLYYIIFKPGVLLLPFQFDCLNYI